MAWKLAASSSTKRRADARRTTTSLLTGKQLSGTKTLALQWSFVVSPTLRRLHLNPRKSGLDAGAQRIFAQARVAIFLRSLVAPRPGSSKTRKGASQIERAPQTGFDEVAEFEQVFAANHDRFLIQLPCLSTAPRSGFGQRNAGDVVSSLGMAGNRNNGSSDLEDISEYRASPAAESQTRYQMPIVPVPQDRGSPSQCFCNSSYLTKVRALQASRVVLGYGARPGTARSKDVLRLLLGHLSPTRSCVLGPEHQLLGCGLGNSRPSQHGAGSHDRAFRLSSPR